MREFSSLNAVLASGAARLLRVSRGDLRAVEHVLTVRRVMLCALEGSLHDRPLLSTSAVLLDYLQADLADAANERVRVLYLDARNQLLRNEIQAEGTLDEAPIYIRQVISRALELGSAAVILIHNHPSGDHTPSRADIEITRRLATAGLPLGIHVHDHLIISRKGHTSMRALGLL